VSLVRVFKLSGQRSGPKRLHECLLKESQIAAAAVNNSRIPFHDIPGEYEGSFMLRTDSSAMAVIVVIASPLFRNSVTNASKYVQPNRVK